MTGIDLKTSAQSCAPVAAKLSTIRSTFVLFAFPLLVARSDPGTQVDSADRSAKNWSLHFQQTTVTQWHPGFPSPYAGENSFQSEPETRTSLTSTLFFGVRVWSGAEFYLDPEISGGRGLSGATGIAGFPNGETFRIGDPTPTLFPARVYFLQRIGFAKERETLEDGPNQLAANIPVNRLTLLAGKFCLADFFDDNTYSHDPRSQFLNWALMNNGAWDYAADTRGYTWGLMVEYNQVNWALRVAATLVPHDANQLTMDTHLNKANSLNLEFERRYMCDERRGVVRLLFYRNLARMGNYLDAIENPIYQMDVTLTRWYSRTKYGVGLNFEQQLSNEAGLFARLGWNDGKNETWAYTEIDRSLTFGGLIEGASWGRTKDQVGAAIVMNGLSHDHADYLAAGGYGFLIGDGRLNYGSEMIFESFYSFQLTSAITLSGDYQFVVDPGYNRDRGPVHVLGARVHVEI